jgi:hypothetical protein
MAARDHLRSAGRRCVRPGSAARRPQRRSPRPLLAALRGRFAACRPGLGGGQGHVTATAFVGREDVLGQLGQALAAAAAGAGCVALVYGEAGIGKTRLCQQLQDEHLRPGGRRCWGAARRRNRRSPTARLRTRCALPAGPSRGCGKRRGPGLVLRAVTPEIGDADRPGGGADRPVVFEALLDTLEEAAFGDQAVLWVLRAQTTRLRSVCRYISSPRRAPGAEVLSLRRLGSPARLFPRSCRR